MNLVCKWSPGNRSWWSARCRRSGRSCTAGRTSASPCSGSCPAIWKRLFQMELWKCVAWILFEKGYLQVWQVTYSLMYRLNTFSMCFCWNLPDQHRDIRQIEYQGSFFSHLHLPPFPFDQVSLSFIFLSPFTLLLSISSIIALIKAQLLCPDTP